MTRPLIPSQTLALAVGALLLTVGGILVYDAFEGRGIRSPWPLRIVLPW